MKYIIISLVIITSIVAHCLFIYSIGNDLGKKPSVVNYLTEMPISIILGLLIGFFVYKIFLIAKKAFK
jgi:hypothetical protein